MKFSKIYLTVLLLSSTVFFGGAYAQKNQLRVDPPHWWKNSAIHNIQLCLYAPNIQAYSLEKLPAHITLDSVWKAPNPNYLFVYITFDDAVADAVEFTLRKGSKKQTFKYRFENLDRSRVDPIDPSDNMYLVFPDRFANGNPQNDSYSGYQEKANRAHYHGRHGGDLQGITQHLDYIDDLGMTAVWLNPTLQTDEKEGSYHGYALTDHYHMDRRICTDEEYMFFGDSLQKRKMKLVMDVVPNHVGLNYWMLRDLMDKNMLNQWDSFTQCNFKPSTLMDPYSSEYDKERTTRGWFVPSMPDINERHPHFGRYMMQSYLWWVNYAGIDGFRIDTYPYNEIDYMDQCLKYIKQEYPDFWFTGETWDEASVDAVAYYSDGLYSDYLQLGHELNSSIDFHFYASVLHALQLKPGWWSGVTEITSTLAQDRQYRDANLNMTFVDNHDIDRFYSMIGHDYAKWKQAMVLLYTLRGVPCLYYGTELLFKSDVPRQSDGQVRQDMPGGWPGDATSVFSMQTRTDSQQMAYKFVSQLTQLHHTYNALNHGKLVQFLPHDGLYTYFRSDDKDVFMVCSNFSEEKRTVDTKKYAECIKSRKHAFDLLSTFEVNAGQSFELAPHEVRILFWE